MKINEVKDRINASYNTIKKFILSEENYHVTKDNVLHVTEEGYDRLVDIYGIKSTLLSDDSLEFYKIQLKLLHDQLSESRRFNQVFTNQIEYKDNQMELLAQSLSAAEKKIYEKELEIQKYQFELELEKNKSIFRKIFSNKKPLK